MIPNGVDAGSVRYNTGLDWARKADLSELFSEGRALPFRPIFLFTLVLCAGIMASRTAGFTRTAVFAGDTWEFQSVAVNFAKGRGFPKFGQVLAFEEYRFERLDPPPPHLARFIEAGRDGGRDLFYRTPVYPFALGCFYKAFGVRPWAAKALQALLLALAAASMVWVGREFWGDVGLVSGALAGPLYCAVYGYQAGHILTEPLLTPSLAGVVVAYMAWRAGPGRLRAAAVGLALAVALGVKGSVLFLPPLTAVLMAVTEARAKFAERAAHAALALAVAAACVAPYSLFASGRVGRFVLLSTQGDLVLLDNNNEYSIAKGAWSSEWRADPASFYNRAVPGAMPPLRKVLAYYSARPADLPRAVAYKLESGFRYAVFLKFVLAALLVEGLFRVWARTARLPEDPRGMAGGLFAALAVAAGLAAARVIGFLPLLGGAAAAAMFGRGGTVVRLFSGLHAALLANFLAVMALIDGVPRYFSVVEPFFMLLAFRVAFATAFDPGRWAETILADAETPGRAAGD